MAVFQEKRTNEIYEYASKWKQKSLLDGDSLLWEGKKVWTPENLAAFQKCFVESPDESDNNFETKFEQQLKNQSEDVYRLACEIVFLYFLFPSSVTQKRKLEVLKKVASWKGLEIPKEPSIGYAFETGIGNCGSRYNMNRPHELKYIAILAQQLCQLPVAERSELLNDHMQFRTALDEWNENTTAQSRHILLHLLFPEFYERIASGSHKREIAKAFAGLIKDEPEETDLDDRIYKIRQELKCFVPEKNLDFYRGDLRACWLNGGKQDELSPSEGLVLKKQIVLYGPPGTGKTHEAKEIAAQAIRQAILREWGATRYFHNLDHVQKVIEQRIRRVQFHPGYGYEDLIRGLHMVGGGMTEYKDGLLLQVTKAMEKADPDCQALPYVVILDEMNRADLSKVLGECFSLMEDRDQKVYLAGQDDEPVSLTLPENLYFIGTMNLVDQSIEQVDFALRRRFLWVLRGFEQEAITEVAQIKWSEKVSSNKWTWEKVKEHFELLADRAGKLNKLISDCPLLGETYEIGHTYFLDVIPFFVELVVKPSLKIQQALFDTKNKAKEPVQALWRYSLEPLLKQYLSSADKEERDRLIRSAEAVFLRGAK